MSLKKLLGAGDNVADAAGDAAKSVAKNADDAAVVAAKNADDAAVVAANSGKAIDSKSLDNMSDVGKNKLVNTYITKLKAKTAVTAIDKKNIETIAKSVKTDADLVKLTGKPLSEIAKTGGFLDSAKKWWADPKNAKNVDRLVKAGLVAGGLALLMIITGETNPIKAVGDALKTAAKEAADVASDAGKSFLDSLGISEFFSKFKWWIIGFFIFLLVVLGLTFIL